MIERKKAKQLQDITIKHSVGETQTPVLSWAGGPKSGYLWIGDGDHCLFTVHGAELRRLAEMVKGVLG